MSTNLGRVLGAEGEGSPPARLRSGALVRAVDKATTPWTVTVEVDEVEFPGVMMQGWYDPQAGDRVQVLQQGRELYVLGTAAPGRVAAVAVAEPPPPPPPPPTEPTRKTVSVKASGSSSWDTRYTRWREDGVYQGGGWSQRGFWYYGSGIAVAKGSGTIVAASIFVRRLNTSHGVAGSQKGNVRLGTHSHGAQPGTGGGAHSNVARIGGLARGEGATFPLTSAQVSALNAGAVGVGLEPGALGYSSVDYIIAAPRSAGDWSGALTLTVET